MIDQILVFLAGFLWLTLVSVQTVFVAQRRLLPLALVAFITSTVWVFLVYRITTDVQRTWFFYCLGTTVGSIVGCWVGHTLNSRLR